MTLHEEARHPAFAARIRALGLELLVAPRIARLQCPALAAEVRRLAAVAVG